ncbi:DUF2726 domain-containing protein [Bacillus sp. V3B]|uniref:DUF2726 domain-containing protein n=1 Tax=Bacillus sp. V3B TaxID=2804915 RepID=UPI00210C94BA|nr:DUF2726 domain-containing protein [Bacillus sp. V3B]MCQ6276300.1 DUF2726 domain-containing protein [Bacillus sp. V3B]
MGKAKTTEQFKQEVFESTGDEYEVLGEYVKAKVEIEMFHQLCGQPFTMRPDNFKSGQRCPHCFGYKKRTLEQFKKEVFDLVGDEYQVVSEYINTNTNITMIHKECGKPFEVTPKNFIHRGDRCSNKECRYKRMADKLSLTTEEFKARVYEQVKDEYIVLGDWDGANNNIKLFHTVCEQEIDMTPNNFYHHKKRCVYCSDSKGERAIMEWLTKNSFRFIKEFKGFKDCRHKRVLPFDYAVFNEDESILTLIEFHGIHHYKAVKGWGGRGKLERAQLTDGIKRNYCLSNNIRVLVIPYWEFDNIDSILDKYLKEREILNWQGVYLFNSEHKQIE